MCSYMKGPDLVISQPKDCLDNMGDWCVSHHAASGKIDICIMFFINNPSDDGVSPWDLWFFLFRFDRESITKHYLRAWGRKAGDSHN